MELSWVQAFIAVAEELHFGRAAERLRIAQSPLSQTIKKLEWELDARLFERNTRSVSLTAEGTSFLPHAREALEQLELGRRAVKSNGSEVYGRIDVGFSGALNHRTLPLLTRELLRRHPNIDLQLIGSVLTQEGLNALRQGVLDLSFVGLPVTARKLQYRVVSREPLGAVLPTDHRHAHEASIELAQLAGDEFVTLPQRQGSSLRESVMLACSLAGFRPNVVQESVDAHIVLSMIAAGIGVSLMPECVADITPAGTVYIPLSSPVHYFEASIAWNPARVSPALQALLDIADEVLPSPSTLSPTATTL